MGCDLVIRGLDLEALEKAADEGTDLFGLDGDFASFFKTEAVHGA